MSYAIFWKPYFNTKLNTLLSRFFSKKALKTTEISLDGSDLKDDHTDFTKDFN